VFRAVVRIVGSLADRSAIHLRTYPVAETPTQEDNH
jgi:hypothetical protein